MVNITNREFSPESWNRMLIDAANSRRDGEEPKNICRVIYPNDTCTLELKTDQEIKSHFQEHGYWSANCVKMPLGEVLNITRICSLNHPVEPQLVDSLQGTLRFLASRAERKYNDGCTGVIRKIISIFFNLFATDSVHLFGESGTDVYLAIVSNSNRSKLPWFIGNNADFARLIFS